MGNRFPQSFPKAHERLPGNFEAFLQPVHERPSASTLPRKWSDTVVRSTRSTGYRQRLFSKASSISGSRPAGRGTDGSMATSMSDVRQASRPRTEQVDARWPAFQKAEDDPAHFLEILRPENHSVFHCTADVQRACFTGSSGTPQYSGVSQGFPTKVPTDSLFWIRGHHTTTPAGYPSSARWTGWSEGGSCRPIRGEVDRKGFS